MNFEQIRIDQQQKAKDMMYQNSSYQFERRDKKILVLDIVDTDTSAPLSTGSDFSVNLFEPLIIDKLSDILVDNVSTYNSLLCDSNNKTAFSLTINEFNVNSNVASSASNQQIFNKILIPNENNDINNIHSVVIHKGKKMNYICSINPGKITKLSGRITDLEGNSMFSTSNIKSVLHHVKLDDPVTTNIPIGTIFGFDGGQTGGSTTTGFKTAFYINEGSTDLYFYNDVAVLNSFTSSATREVGSTESGLNSLTANTSKYREGDYPRFTVELIIEAN